MIRAARADDTNRVREQFAPFARYSNAELDVWEFLAEIISQPLIMKTLARHIMGQLSTVI